MKHLAQTKICETYVALWIQKYIFWFQVSVDDPQLKQTNQHVTYFQSYRDYDMHIQYGVYCYQFWSSNIHSQITVPQLSCVLSLSSSSSSFCYYCCTFVVAPTFSAGNYVYESREHLVTYMQQLLFFNKYPPFKENPHENFIRPFFKFL
jgi:hypothetical protein